MIERVKDIQGLNIREKFIEAPGEPVLGIIVGFDEDWE